MTPVVLSTGLGLPARVWAPVVAQLEGRLEGQPEGRIEGGCEVVLLDRPGLGRLSHEAAHPLVLDREVERIARAVRSLEGGPAILVGHSMGAFLVEAAARVHPELTRALVLVDGSVEEDPSRSGRTRTAAHSMAGSMAQALHLGSWVSSAIAENTSYPDLAADLAALRLSAPLPDVPTIVLAAIRHDWWPPNRAWLRRQQRLVECLRATSARPDQATVSLEVVRGSGHQMMRDAPTAIATAIASVYAGR